MFPEYFVFVIISFSLKTLYPMHRNTSNFSSPGHFQTACQSGCSQSASLLAHNRIAASQLIRSGLYHSWYKQVPTHCLLLFAIEAGDLLDSVKLPPYFQPHFLWILMCIKCCSTLTCFLSSVEMLFSCLSLLSKAQDFLQRPWFIIHPWLHTSHIVCLRSALINVSAAFLDRKSVV